MLIFWSCKKNRLDYKDKINFNIDHVTTSLTNNCNTHIDQIPRSKGNQALKFRHLTLSWRRPLYIETSPLICPANQWTSFYMITACVMKGLREHNMRNIFIEKSCAKCVEETTPDVFLKKSKFTIALINSLILNTCFVLLHAKLWTIEIWAPDHLLRPHINLFLKNKKRYVSFSA